MTYKPRYILTLPGAKFRRHVFRQRSHSRQHCYRLEQRRTIPVSRHTCSFNISLSKHALSGHSWWRATHLTVVYVAGVLKSPKKMRPEIALVVGKGAQRGQNKCGEDEMTRSQQRIAATFTYRMLFIGACQLARVVRVHVCYYSLRA